MPAERGKSDQDKKRAELLKQQEEKIQKSIDLQVNTGNGIPKSDWDKLKELDFYSE